MTLALDRRSRLWHRPAAHDRVIIDEVRAVYRDLPIRHGDVFLDLGAHIGATSRLALSKGAARVIAVEADPDTVPVLRRNLERWPAEIIWAAVGPEDGRTEMHCRPDRPHLSTLVADDEGRRTVDVPMVAFRGLLERRPTVVKCDIEFGEYALAELHALPRVVRVLALEVHIRYDLVFAHRRLSLDELILQRQRAAQLIAAVEAQGFRAVRRKDKQATGEREVHDDTGLPPLTKSVDAIWAR